MTTPASSGYFVIDAAGNITVTPAGAAYIGAYYHGDFCVPPEPPQDPSLPGTPCLREQMYDLTLSVTNPRDTSLGTVTVVGP